jgi:hypothetical protein
LAKGAIFENAAALIKGQILELSMLILEANTHTPGLPFSAINQN